MIRTITQYFPKKMALYPCDRKLKIYILKMECTHATSLHISSLHPQLLNNKLSLRGIILRPSLVWSMKRPGALLPVAAFQIGR